MATPVTNAVGLTGDARIDGLVQGGAWEFDGESRVITYSLSLYFATTLNTWTRYPPFIDIVRGAFAAWSNVANVSLVETGSGGLVAVSPADIAVTLVGGSVLDAWGSAIVVPPDPLSGDDFLAFANLTRQRHARPEGDIFFNNATLDWEYIEPGSFGYRIILASIGSALGLKHPLDDAGSGRPTLEELGLADIANSDHTIMTEANPFDGSYALGRNPASPMPLDVLAIQHIYGANTGFHTGNDTYVMNSRSLFVTVWDAGGIDTVDASEIPDGGTIDLREGHESNMQFIARLAIAYNTVIENAIGSRGSNTIIGNDAANRLDGGLGRDTLLGGKGDDAYVVDSGDDIVVENVSEGTDTVFAKRSYALPAHVENMTLLGPLRADATGNELGNTLIGSATDNVLDGGAGDDFIDGGDWADTMRGGPGNDTYVVSQFDRPVEPTILTLRGEERAYILPGETRTLRPSDGMSVEIRDFDWDGDFEAIMIEAAGGWSFSVGAPGLHVGTYRDFGHGEPETTASMNFSGEGRGSYLFKTATINVLEVVYNGRFPLPVRIDLTFHVIDNGANIWGTFNYNYIGPRTPELVIESPDEGIDTVRSSIEYTLPANVENLVLTGTAAIGGSGNDLGNDITGNAAANVLFGGAGADILRGGGGDDVYEADNVGDNVIEAAGQGTDTVRSAVTFALGANLENLVLTDLALGGTGNELDNRIEGNAADNLLFGGLGNDTLVGGAGDDTARYGGPRSAYTIEDNDGSVIVSGAEGRDTLTEIERVEFADALVSLRGGGLLDLGADGRSDILWSHTDGTVGTWLGGSQSSGQGLGALAGNWSLVEGHGDYDGDGRSDILWRHTDGMAGAWLGGAQANGQGLGALATSWRIVDGHADFNGDGRSDLLWRNADGTLGTWLGGSQANGQGLGSLAATWSTVDAHADYNGDGRSDILWRHTDGTVGTWLGGAQSNGQGLGVLSTSWSIVDGHGDYNGDGRSDILWRHTDGTVGTWLGGSQASGQGLGALPTSWRIVDGHGDYNGDGRSDILWRHTDGTVGAWLSGSQASGQGLGTLPNSWSIVDGHGDYNGDGRSDILWRHTDGTIGTWLGGAQVNGQGLGVIPSGWSMADAAEMGGAIRSGGGSTSGTVGRDTLYGSAESDTLTGHAGADRFAFDTALNAATNVDTLTDFEPGSDVLLLDDVIFTSLPKGPLAAASFVAEANAVAHDGNDFILYDTATGNVSYDADGAGAQAAVRFATLVQAPLLTAQDVYVGLS